MQDSISFDRAAGYYDSTRGGEVRGHAVAGHINAYLPAPPARVIEIGVGTAVVGAALKRYGWRVCGLDISLPMLRHATLRLPHAVVQADAHRIPFRAASLDACLWVFLVDFLADLDTAVSESARILVPHGRVIILVPSASSHYSDVGMILHKFRSHLPSYVSRRRVDELVPIAISHNMKLVADLICREQGEGASPRRARDQIRHRVWPVLWHLSEIESSSAVSCALASLKRLPDQDRVRPELYVTRLLVFETLQGEGTRMEYIKRTYCRGAERL